MKEQIKKTLDQHLSIEYKVNRLDVIEPFIGGIDAAAEAIAALIDHRATPPNPSVSEIVNNFKDDLSLRYDGLTARADMGKCEDRRYLYIYNEFIYIRWGALELDLLEAVAALPVDRVQAMAALIKPIPKHHPDNIFTCYLVPGDDGKVYCVHVFQSGYIGCNMMKGHGRHDSCGRGEDGPHIQAIRLYLAQREAK